MSQVSMVHKAGIYEKYIKRFFDFACALLILICFLWLYLIVAAMVRAKLGSPVIFHQPRPGKDCKIFNLCKFRTMTDEKDADGDLLPDDKRLTPFGAALRSSSLDEIPEIFNILKGEMSFVGPRPLLVKYLPRYSEEQRHRHDVTPGLTGLAQVNGRNSITWEEKFRWDLEYVKNISFALDIKILAQTVLKVFRHEGINAGAEVTMPEFKGTVEL